MNTAKDLGGLAKENRERMMWVHDASESSERPGTIGRERIDVDLWSREGVDLKSEEPWRMEDWSGLVKLGTPPRFTRRETRTFSCSIRPVALNLIGSTHISQRSVCGGIADSSPAPTFTRTHTPSRSLYATSQNKQENALYPL